MLKIVVIGAGHGGLSAAEMLAEAGYDVTVYEKNPRNKIGWDWRDDLEYNFFDEFCIPKPIGSFQGEPVSLVAPLSDKPLLVWSEKEKRDWNIDRRTFLNQLIESAESKGAKLYTDCNVEKLIYDGAGVKGIIVNSEKIFADLVIDSAGLNQTFRYDLPMSFGMTDRITEDNIFSVYRAFTDKREGIEEPTKHRKKIYLKYNGNPGIAWCVCEDGYINILVGRIGPMTDEQLNESLSRLKKDNPIIGDNILRGGITAKIPVRYPLTKMVCPGYAAIGDTAYMTIPLIGSGMANSIRAGRILAERIIHENSVDVKTLWKYQVTYYKLIGADHFLVDTLKRMLLYADNNDLKYVFESGIITEEDLLALSTGSALKLTSKSLAQKIGKGIKKTPFLAALIKAAVRGVKAKLTAEALPKEYDPREIAKWQVKIEKCFR